MSEGIDLKELDPKELQDLFPGIKLTIRERIPTNLLLLYTFLNINKTIKDIKYSADEIGESIRALVAMIPDELRDPEFDKELSAAKKYVLADVRPVFCTTKASLEYCKRKGISAFIKVVEYDYFGMYHAVFNLLMRKRMLMAIHKKETIKEKILLPEDEE